MPSLRSLNPFPLTQQSRLLLVIFIASLFLIAELIVGFTQRSLALVADAFHITSDLIGYVIALVAMRAAESGEMGKVAPEGYSYGYQRAEIIGGFFNATFLTGLGVSVVLQSIERFISPEEVKNPILVLIIGAAGVGSNLLMFAILGGHGHAHGHDHGHSHSHSHGSHSHSHGSTTPPNEPRPHSHSHSHNNSHDSLPHLEDQAGRDHSIAMSTTFSQSHSEHSHARLLGAGRGAGGHGHGHGHGHAGDDTHGHGGHEHGEHGGGGIMARIRGLVHVDVNMLGVLIHILGDALNSIAVIISAAIIYQTHWYYADPLASLFVGFMILLTSIPLLLKAGRYLLETAPEHIDMAGVKSDIERITGRGTVHELHVWSLNQKKTLMSMHLETGEESLVRFQEMADKVRQCLHFWGLHSAVIQPEYSRRYSAHLPHPLPAFFIGASDRTYETDNDLDATRERDTELDEMEQRGEPMELDGEAVARHVIPLQRMGCKVQCRVGCGEKACCL